MAEIYSIHFGKRDGFEFFSYHLPPAVKPDYHLVGIIELDTYEMEVVPEAVVFGFQKGQLDGQWYDFFSIYAFSLDIVKRRGYHAYAVFFPSANKPKATRQLLETLNKGLSQSEWQKQSQERSLALMPDFALGYKTPKEHHDYTSYIDGKRTFVQMADDKFPEWQEVFHKALMCNFQKVFASTINILTPGSAIDNSSLGALAITAAKNREEIKLSGRDARKSLFGISIKKDQKSNNENEEEKPEAQPVSGNGVAPSTSDLEQERGKVEEAVNRDTSTEEKAVKTEEAGESTDKENGAFGKNAEEKNEESPEDSGEKPGALPKSEITKTIDPSYPIRAEVPKKNSIYLESNIDDPEEGKLYDFSLSKRKAIKLKFKNGTELQLILENTESYGNENIVDKIKRDLQIFAFPSETNENKKIKAKKTDSKKNRFQTTAEIEINLKVSEGTTFETHQNGAISVKKDSVLKVKLPKGTTAIAEAPGSTMPSGIARLRQKGYRLVEWVKKNFRSVVIFGGIAVGAFTIICLIVGQGGESTNVLPSNPKTEEQISQNSGAANDQSSPVERPAAGAGSDTITEGDLPAAFVLTEEQEAQLDKATKYLDLIKSQNNRYTPKVLRGYIAELKAMEELSADATTTLKEMQSILDNYYHNGIDKKEYKYIEHQVVMMDDPRNPGISIPETVLSISYKYGVTKEHLKLFNPESVKEVDGKYQLHRNPDGTLPVIHLFQKRKQ